MGVDVVFKVTIPGEPHGKGRPRFSRATGRAFTPKGTAEWERGAAYVIRSEWSGRFPPIDVPATVHVRAVFSRPGRLLRKKDPEGRMPCTKKPDVDNVVKCVLDALTMGGALRDDKVVWKVCAEKLYASKDESGCVEVELYWRDENEKDRDDGHDILEHGAAASCS